MKTRNLEDDKKRLESIIDKSWEIVKDKRAFGALRFNKEPEFQLQFSIIIEKVGQLYCARKTDDFEIVPQYHIEGEKQDRRKYIDITCRLNEATAAIELKCKRDSAAWVRAGIYYDLMKLESYNHDIKAFYFATTSKAYLKNDTIAGEEFKTHDGFNIKPGHYGTPELSAKIDESEVDLTQTYRFNWQRIGEWLFLCMKPKK